MAHYAILDENNQVTLVCVGRDESDDVPGGYTSWEEYYGGKRCSYNTRGGVHNLGGTPFRKNFPAVGWFYDPDRDAFIDRKPFPSWILNEETCLWEPPVPYPENAEYFYNWNETKQEWELAPL